MRYSQMRNKFVSLAYDYVGAVSGGEDHKEIIDIYNTISPLPRGYKMTVKDPWCAAFVSAIARKLDLKDFPYECSCTKMIEKLSVFPNSFYNRGFYAPTIGDLLFYDWESDGRVDHVGIIIECYDNCCKVVEGNRSNKVQIEIIQLNDNRVYGIGVYNWEYNGILEEHDELSDAIEWATTNKLFVGDGNGNYRWKDNITREEIVLILHRLIKILPL